MNTAVVLACDDNFVAYTSCVARRILRSASTKVPIVVLADCVSESNRAKALSVCPQIEFVEVGPLFEKRPFPPQGHLPRATYSRLLLPELLLGLDQALYLDSDIAVLGDVAPLAFTKLNAAPVAAAHDLPMYGAHRQNTRRPVTPGRPYFNGGVAVYDLKAVKSEGIFESALRFSFNHPERCTYHDQDALNHVLDGRWQVLDWRWNAMSFLTESMPGLPVIRHLNGYKPWSANKSNIEPAIVSLWHDDLVDSPWPELFKPATGGIEVKDRWLRAKIYEQFPGPRGRSARFKRDIAGAYREIERTVGQLATPLL